MDEGHYKRKNSTDYLGERHVEAILEELGLPVISQTSTRFQIFCPFHHNIHTTSATVDKGNGFFYCFGAECNLKMNVIEFVQRVRGTAYYPALRFVKNLQVEDIVEQPKVEVFAEDLPKFDTQLLKRYQEDFWSTPRAKSYVKFRGISRYSAELFGLGYDRYKDQVITPMFDKDGDCVGVIRRSIEGKSFKNSPNLPTSKTLFGIHIAKAQSVDEVVICESNFDAILSHQSGHPAVATLGGTFTDFHLTQISRYFNKVILAVDNDEGGHKFAKRIARMCKERGMYVYRMQYSQYEMLPGNVKDFGDVKDTEKIAQAVRFAVPFVLS